MFTNRVKMITEHDVRNQEFQLLGPDRLLLIEDPFHNKLFEVNMKDITYFMTLPKKGIEDDKENSSEKSYRIKSSSCKGFKGRVEIIIRTKNFSGENCLYSDSVEFKTKHTAVTFNYSRRVLEKGCDFHQPISTYIDNKSFLKLDKCLQNTTNSISFRWLVCTSRDFSKILHSCSHLQSLQFHE